MRRWALRISGIFLFSSLFLTSPALADPHFGVRFGFGFPGVYVGFGHSAYPGYAYYPGVAYDLGYPYYYPGYVYPRVGYGYVYPRVGYYGDRYYWGGVRHVRPVYYGRWHGGGWRAVGWRGAGWRGVGWHGGHGHWHR